VSEPVRNASRSQDRGSNSTFAFPTGERSSSTLLVERRAPGEIVVGAPFQYEMRVTNLTNTTLEGVYVAETGGEGLELTGGSLRPKETTGNRAQNDDRSVETRARDTGKADTRGNDSRTGDSRAGGHTWDIGTLGPRESTTIQVEGRASRPGQISSCITAGYTPAACVTMNAVAPALQVKLEAPNQALACEDIPLRFIVSNSGTGTARDVRLNIPMPRGLTATGGDAIDKQVGDIPAGESREVRVMARATGPGEYAASPKVTGAMGLSSEAQPATIVVTQPTLEVAVKSPETHWLGRDTGIDLTVTNTSNVEAQDTRVTADLSGASASSDTGRNGQLAWDFGTLAPKQSKTSHLQLSMRQPGPVSGHLTATARCAPPASAEFRTTVVGVPGLHMDLADNPDPVPVGGETTYTIRVVNQGETPATNVRITVTLPEQEEYVDSGGVSAANTGGGRGARKVEFAPLAEMAPKATAQWTVRVRAAGTGDVRFTASMMADQLTKPVEANESTNLFK